MSLINQALKEEQRRRNYGSSVVNAPMMSMARRQNERGPALLVGFTLMGMALAGIVTFALYFGSQFLDGPTLAQEGQAESSLATSGSSNENAALQPETAAAQEKPEVSNFLEKLSTQELAVVQKMLLEKAQLELNADHPNQTVETTSHLEQDSNQSPAESQSPIASESQIAAQAIVDQFSIQGIRKSGANTRVFMNGRIQKLGDVIDPASGIKLIGFTDSELVFEDPSGNRYTKLL